MKYEPLTAKKKQLDSHRPLPRELADNLDEWFRVELTYTSNAIEGNTLSRRETAMVVEKGITVGGKSLVEHLEATNHAAAIDWVKAQIERKPQGITESDILDIHRLILKGIDDQNAGRYRNVAVLISGSTVVMPNPVKVPDLMSEFVVWLKASKNIHPVELATDAHYRLVSIHPFVDGNGRTARLLMNMILLMSGYPAAIIRKRDRLKYISALEKAQLEGAYTDFQGIVYKAVDRSLDIYLSAIEGESVAVEAESDLMKIGQLAKKADVPNSTIRHWTKNGLLEFAEVTKSGYQLYAPESIDRARQIIHLKAQRFTLNEIREKLDDSPNAS